MQDLTLGLTGHSVFAIQRTPSSSRAQRRPQLGPHGSRASARRSASSATLRCGFPFLSSSLKLTRAFDCCSTLRSLGRCLFDVVRLVRRDVKDKPVGLAWKAWAAVACDQLTNLVTGPRRNAATENLVSPPGHGRVEVRESGSLVNHCTNAGAEHHGSRQSDPHQRTESSLPALRR